MLNFPLNFQFHLSRILRFARPTSVPSRIFLFCLLLGAFCLNAGGSLRAEFFSPAPEDPIFGEALAEDDVEDKVILLIFWRSDSPECLAGLGKMNQINNWLRNSDQLIILGSLLEEFTPEVGELLEKSHCTFPVYERFVPDCVELPEEEDLKLPLIFLFQEDGTVAASGTPDEISTKLPESFKKRMEARARAGFRYAPLTEVILPDGLEEVEPYFAPNRSWEAGFRRLDALMEDAENDLSTDAQVLRDQLLILIYDELERLEKLAETQPGEAGYRLHLLLRNLTNLDPYEDASDQLTELRKRRGVSEMISVYSNMEYLQSMVKSGGRPLRMRNMAYSVHDWLYTLAHSASYDPAIKAEAAFLYEIVDKKMNEF